MHRGYTKRWRKRWEKGYHQNFLVWVLIDYFIDFANYKDTEIFIDGKMVTVKRGEHLFGTHKLAEFFNCNRSHIRRSLKILKNIGFSTIRSTNKYSILSVINYDTYNPAKNNLTTGTSLNRPTTDQQPTTPNELKKVKKEKKEKPEWLDLDLWKEFKIMRVRLKAPLTEYAETRAILKLKSLMDKGYKQEDILNQSIECSWKGLFPVKYKKDDVAYPEDPFQGDLFLRQAYDLIGKDKEFANHCMAFNRNIVEVMNEIKKIKEV